MAQFRLRALLLGTTALLPVVAQAQAPGATPQGGRVVAGQASISQNGTATTITQGSNRAAIDWNRFDVGRDASVNFQQPNAGSWTLNRVTTPDPSRIAGRITANGGVAIVNQSGVVFANGAQVNVGALIASAANISNENFMAGRMVFDGAPRPGARVENHGDVTVADRGLAVFVGPGVSNTGTIRARLGRVALAGAETYTLDMAGDGLLSIDVTQRVRAGGGAIVTNAGVIEAQGGAVLLSAQAASGLVEDVVRQSGRITANADAATGRTGQVALRGEGGRVRVEGTVQAAGGRITAEAPGGAVSIARSARLDASAAGGGGTVAVGGSTTRRVRLEGEATARGGTTAQGGRVTLQAQDRVTAAAGALADASGGTGGGTVLAGTTGIGRAQAMAARTNIERGATLRADATQAGAGGTVVVNSTTETIMRGDLSARGGPQGGNGGFVEISGQKALDILGTADTRAPAGALGTLLIDPRNIVVSNNPLVTLPGGGTVTVTQTGATALDATIGVALANTGGANDWLRLTTDTITGYAGGNITLSASRNLIVDTGFTRNTAGTLVLDAVDSITLRSGADISVNGKVVLGTSGNIAINANITATSLDLVASGGILQAGSSALSHRAGPGTPLPIVITSSNNDVFLASAANGALRITSAVVDTSPPAPAGGNLVLRGSTLALAGEVRAEAISLTATSGITQEAGSVLRHNDGLATPLPISVLVTGAGDVALQQAGNGYLFLGTPATTQGSVRAVSGTAATGLVVAAAINATGDVRLQTPGQLPVNATITAGGAIALQGAVVATAPGATLTVGNGGSVTLTADDMTIGARVAAPAGSIRVQTLNAGRRIFLGADQGGGDPAGLWLNKDETGFLGGSGAGGSTVAAARLAFIGDADVSLVGNLDFRSRVTALELQSGAGGVTQTAGDILDVPRLVVRASGGNIAIANTGNRIDEVAAVTGGGAAATITLLSTAPATAATRVVTDTGIGGVTTGLSGAGTINLTGNGLALEAPVVASGAAGLVALTAQGAAGITQTAAGLITTTTLTAAATTGGAPITLDAGGAAAAAAMNQVAVLGTAQAGGGVSFATGQSLAINGDVSGNGDLRLTSAGTLTQNAGRIRAFGADRTIRLTADTLAFASPLSPSVATPGANGTVVLRPFSADTGIEIAPGSAFLADPTQLARVQTGTLSLQASGSGGIAINAALDLTGIAGTLDLRGASVTQAAPITVGALRGSATAGAFALDHAGNAIATAGGITALAGDARLTSAQPLTLGSVDALGLTAIAPSLTVAGPLNIGAIGTPGAILLQAGAGGIGLGSAAVTTLGAGSSIELRSAGAIAQANGGAGALSADALRLVETAPGVAGDLRGTGNAVGTVDSTLAAGLRLANSTALTVTGGGVLGTTGDVSLSAASLAIEAPIAAAGQAVTLTATSGSITQSTGAAITAATLGLNAPAGSALLDGGGGNAVGDLNAIGTLGASTVRDTLRLRQLGNLSLDGLLSRNGGTGRIGAVEITTVFGGLSQTPGSVLRAASLGFDTAGSVTLSNAGNELGTLSGVAGGAVAVTATPSLPGGAPLLSLGAIDASGISVTALGGGIAVTGTQTASLTGVTLSATRLDLGANIDAAGQAVSLSASGPAGIVQSAGRIRAATLALNAPAGGAVLDNGNPALALGLNEIGTLSSAVVQGALTLRNQGALTLPALISADGGAAPSGAVTLHAQTGDLVQPLGGVLRAASATLTAPAGTLRLPGSVLTSSGVVLAANAIDFTGSIANSASGGVSVQSPLDLVLGGSIAAPGQRLTLLSDGAISQAGAGTLAAAELVARGIAPGSAATSIELGGLNSIGALAEARSSGDLRLRSTEALSVTGAARAGDAGLLRLETPGVLTIATTGSVRAGDPVALDAGVVTLWGAGLRIEGPVQAGDGVVLVAAGGAMSFAAYVPTGSPTATITQTAAGAEIAARRLTTVAEGLADLDASGNSVGLFSHFGLAGADLVWQSGSALRLGDGVAFLSPANEVAQVSGIAGNNGNVTLRAPAIEVLAPVTAGSGRAVTFRTDALTLADLVTANDGSVVLRPITPGTDVALGTALPDAPGRLSLSVAELANLRTGTLRVQGDAGTDILLGVVDLRATPATRAARRLLLEGGATAQQAGGVLSVEEVSASLAGALNLGEGGAAGNSINRLGAITAGGEVTIRAGGVADGAGGRRAPAVDALGAPLPGTQPLSIAASLTAGGPLTLRTDGLVLAPGATLSAGGGAMTLGTFSDGLAVVLGAADSGPGALRLASDVAPRLLIGGASPTLALTASGGAITVAGAFDLSAPGGPGLLRVEAGSLVSNAGGGLRVSELDATTTLGAADMSPGNHGVATLTLRAPAGADTGLTTDQALLVRGIATAVDGAVGRVTLSAPSLTLQGPVRGGSVSLTATAPGATIIQAAALEAATLTLASAGGAATLDRTDNRIAHLLAADLGSGALRLVTGGALSLDAGAGPGILTGRVEITADSIGPALPGGAQRAVITASGGPAGPRLRLTALLGDLELGNGSALAASGPTDAAIALTAAGALRLTGASLTAADGITLGAGTTATLANVTLGAAGALSVAATDTLSLDTVTATAVLGATLGAGTDATVTASAITAGGDLSLTAGGAATLANTTLDAGGALSVAANGALGLDTVTATAGLGATLSAGTDATVTASGITAGADLALTAGGAATLASTTLDAGGALSVAATNALSLDTVTATVVLGATLSAGTDATVIASSIASGGDLSLTAGGAAALANTTLDAGGALSVAATDALSLDTVTATAALGATLSAGADTNVTASGITAGGDLSLTAGGAATLANTTLDAGGALSVTATDALSLGTVTATAGLGATFSAGTDATVTASGITAGGDLSLTAGGAATLANTTLDAGGALSVAAAGALGLDTVTATAVLGATFSAGTDATVTASAMTAGGDLAVTAGGAATLANTTLDAVGALSVAATGALGLDTVTATAALGATLSAGADANVTASGITAGGDLSLTAGGATTLANTTLDAGDALSVTATGAHGLDTVAATAGLGATFTAGADATVTASAMTAGGDLALTAGGAATAANTTLDAGGALSVAATGALSLDTVTANAGLGATFTAGAGAIVTASGITVGENLSLAAGGVATLATTTLDAGGALNVTATGALGLDTVAATAGLGATFTAGTDATVTASAMTAGGDLALTAGGVATLAHTTLDASGALSVAATGALSLDTVTATAGLGATLSAGTGATLTDTTLNAGRTLRVAAGGALGLARVGLATPRGIQLESGAAASLDASTLTAGGAFSLLAGGATSLGASTISTAQAFSWNAGGATVLTGSTLSAGGGLTLATGGALTASNAQLLSGQAMALQVGGDATLSLTGLQAGQGLRLETARALSSTGGRIEAGQEVTLQAGGRAEFFSTPIIAGEALNIVAGGPLAATGARFDANEGMSLQAADRLALLNQTLNAAGSIRLQAGTVLETRGGAMSSVGDVSLDAGASMTLRQTQISGFADVALRAGGGLDITGGRVDAVNSAWLQASLGLSASNANISGRSRVTLVSGDSMALSGTNLGALAAVTLQSGLGLTVTDGTMRVAGIIALTAGGAASVTGGTLEASGGAVTLRADGAATFSGTALAAGTDIVIDAAGAVALGNMRPAAGRDIVILAGDGVALNSVALNAGNAARLAAGGGITFAASQVTATDIAGLAGGAITLGASTLTAARDVTLRAGGGFNLGPDSSISGATIALQSGGGMGLSGRLAASNTITAAADGPLALSALNVSAEQAAFRTRGAASLSGVEASIGALFVVSAPGGIAAPGPTTVTPRAPAQRLPAVVFDTRAQAFASPQPFLVLPDLPGLAASQQPTQLRAAPRSQLPGVFGNATAAAAGPIELALTARDSAVFLLADSATINGAIDAARLGVHGTGGSGSLSGRLAGKDGITAAEFADMTRPIEPASLVRYRLNNCVLSAINCTVLPSIIALQSRPGTDVVVQLDRQRLRDPDIITPDVSQRDY
jgi:filamentous hemagglutinin family protein